MAAKHWIEVAAMAAIGEGVVGALYPERYLALWRIGPKPLQSLVDALAGHPSAMRAVFAAQIAAGYWLARKQLETEGAAAELSATTTAGAAGGAQAAR